MRKPNIRQHVQQAIYSGMQATVTVKNGQSGVVFHDENEFIPFANLAYNRALGYFDRSLFPDEPSETDSESPYTIHPLATEDGWQAWVLEDEGGTLTLLGELWQIADLADALRHFVDTGEYHGKPVDDYDPNWGSPLTMAEATAYIVAQGWTPGNADDTLRKAAAAGRVPGAQKDGSGHRWVFSRRGLDAWLRRAGQGGYARLGR